MDKGLPTMIVVARIPQRERGKQTVARLIDSGASVIAERGYGGATMVEIAARAGASIGSLYQFFPSKEVLAGALLRCYGERVAVAFDAVMPQAAGASPRAISEALINVMIDVRVDRGAAMSLLDSRGEPQAACSKLRAIMLGRIERLLLLAMPRVSHAKARTMSVMLLHILRTIPRLLAENSEMAPQLREEACDAMQLYISNAIG